MELDKRPSGQSEGCLVGVLRIPAKVVAVLIVLPLRVVWDLLAAFGRAAHRHVLGPLWTHALEPLLRGLGWVLTVLLKLVFVWPWVGLWRYVLAPVGRALYAYLLSPVGRVTYRYLLRPIGLGIAWACDLTWRHVLVPLGRGVYRYLLRPLGTAVAWLARGVYAYVLAPVGRLFLWAWHVAGRIVKALWRGIALVGRVLIVWPCAQVHRYVLTPLGHVLRDAWRTVRATVRQVRAEVRRALLG
ncbi:hypothetical protein ACFV7Q_19550 [Streptomyces sp. NPDC059851]|uniref:hypothetical protein n=1 Tax=Streptomyces sp. NPDC059851 TaxID=3346971 RepID=UPI003651B92C